MFGSRSKFAVAVIASALLGTVSLAYWNTQDKQPAPASISSPEATKKSTVKNVSTMSRSQLADIPPEAFHPQPPMPGGYNASSGQLPPGALPPGVVLPGMSGGRTAGQGYGTYDGVRQQFTGKERDNETGLDYFGARYYSSLQGRFTSPDEFSGGPQEVYTLGKGDPEKQALPYADITNPQSLNKYSYAYNNPLRFVDPNGHQGITDSIMRYWEALVKRFNDQLHPEEAAQDARSSSPANPNWGAVVEGHAAMMGQAAELAWNVASVADITGVGSVFHGVASNNRTEAALGVAVLPLSEIFGLGKGAITSGELMVGRVGKAEVAAQFSKEGNTLVAGIGALFNDSKGLVRESSAKQLFQSIAAFAKEQGLSKVEVQAIAVRNPSLERKLVQQGFQKTTVHVLGEDVPAYSKTFNVR